MVADSILWGIVVACAAFSYTRVVVGGELLQGVGRAINRLIHSQDYPADDIQLNGWRWVLHKYTYCAFCLSGFLGLWVSIQNLNLAIFVAMTVAKIIEVYEQRR